MDIEYLLKIKSLAKTARSEMEKLGDKLESPAVSVSLYNSLPDSLYPSLRSLVSNANQFIPALIAEVEQLLHKNRLLSKGPVHLTSDELEEKENEAFDVGYQSALIDSKTCTTWDNAKTFQELKQKNAAARKALENLLRLSNTPEERIHSYVDDLIQQAEKELRQDALHHPDL